MSIYEFDNETLEVSKELERAVIKRYLEKRYISTLYISCFVIGFLLGVISYAL